MSANKSTKAYQKPTVSSIEIEASVVLSIIKHSSENYPHPVSGPALGFDNENGTLTVSHAYPYPNVDQVEGASFRSKLNTRYQQDIFDELKEIGYGTEFFGWYQSTINGTFVRAPLIEALAHQQLARKNSFVIINNLSNYGNSLNLKAYRLSENFMKTYINGKFQTPNLNENDLSYTNLLDEIPITIHNTHLINLYLQKPNEDTFEPTSNLNLNNNTHSLSATLESLFDSIDDFNYEQNNFNYYQRHFARESSKINQWKQKRKAENASRVKNGEKELSMDEWESLFKLPTEPSRYDTLLVSSAINNLVNELEVSGNCELIKTFGVQKELDL